MIHGCRRTYSLPLLCCCRIRARKAVAEAFAARLPDCRHRGFFGFHDRFCRGMAFQRFRPRKTPVRKPSFCKDFCEEATRHKITSRRVTEEFNYTTLPLISSNPPYATFLFLSAAQAGEGG